MACVTDAQNTPNMFGEVHSGIGIQDSIGFGLSQIEDEVEPNFTSNHFSSG